MAQNTEQQFEPACIAGWTRIQCSAWRLRVDAPGSFLYRFCITGLRISGDLDAAESRSLLEQIVPFYAEGWPLTRREWGFLARNVCGARRNGRQCRDHFAELVRRGEAERPPALMMPAEESALGGRAEGDCGVRHSEPFLVWLRWQYGEVMSLLTFSNHRQNWTMRRIESASVPRSRRATQRSLSKPAPFGFA